MENITGSDGERDGKGVTRPTSQSCYDFQVLLVYKTV